MTFKPGQSGNPNGRPPKTRALTAILETELNKSIPTLDGRKVAKKREMARMASDLLATGRTAYPDGRELQVEDFRDYFELMRWAYKHIDGDVLRQEVTGKDGGPVQHEHRGQVHGEPEHLAAVLATLARAGAFQLPGAGDGDAAEDDGLHPA